MRKHLTRLAAVTLTAATVLTSTGVAAADGNVTDTATPPQHLSSLTLLPPWAETYNVTGAHELWLQPIYYVNDPRRPWEADALLANVNTTMEWFTVASRNTVTVTATKMLDPIWVTDENCSTLTRTWSSHVTAWKGTNPPANTHLVGLTRLSACPWGGLGATPGRDLIVARLNETPRVNPDILIHEFGHNLGLPHARSYSGAALSSTRQRAATPSQPYREYGDPTDPMGVAGLYRSTSTWNPAGMAALGWGDGVLHVPSSSTVTIEPVTAPGPDAITFDDPVTATRYMLTYNHNDNTAGQGRGVFLYETRHNDAEPTTHRNVDLSLATFIPLHAQYSWIGASVGTTWTAPSGAVAFHVNTTDNRHAAVTVTIDPTGSITDQAGPAWVNSEPSATWTRKNPTVTFGAAWDQSGVTVRVRAGKGKFRRVSNADPLNPSDITVPLPRSNSNTVTVTVRLTDRAGNTTDWTRRVTRRP